MKHKFCQVVQFVFKFGCFLVVVGMISVWLKKYLKDEDLCLVDYVSFKNNTKIEHPLLSFCFMHPFIDQNLEEFGVNSNAYLNHLKATPFIENLTKIDFRNVTINLKDYYLSTGISYWNGEHSFIDADMHPAFIGFWYDQFMKCFSVDSKELNMPDVKFLIHQFKLDFLPYLKQTIAIFHGRHQFLLSDSGKIISSDENASNGTSIILTIAKVEILQRRYKRSSPCVMNGKNWDELALLKHTRDIGCSAPYHASNPTFSTCTTSNETKGWYKMVPTVKSNRDDQPCQVMPRITTDVFNGRLHMEKEIEIVIGFPPEAKVITQSRAVDVGALIGNIGDYIGLFLGMLYLFIILIFS